MNLRIREIQLKHEEEKKRKRRREEEIKNMRKMQHSNTKIFLKRRGLHELTEPGDEAGDEYRVKSLIKTEKLRVENDPTRFKASVELFDDLFETFDIVSDKMQEGDDEEWRNTVHARFRLIMIKYQGVFEEHFINHKMNKFAKDYLNVDL